MQGAWNPAGLAGGEEECESSEAMGYRGKDREKFNNTPAPSNGKYNLQARKGAGENGQKKLNDGQMLTVLCFTATSCDMESCERERARCAALGR